MCARYYIEEDDRTAPLIEEMNRSPLMSAVPAGQRVVTEGEVSPGCVAPVMAMNRTGRVRVFPMQWGFPGKSLMINARVETAAEKPTFREAWKAHRCIVPASWYYEWEHRTRTDGKTETGDKYMIQPEGSAAAWMCGLYRIENGLPVFVILTQEAEEPIRFIHDRMPMMLPEERIEEWIRPDCDAAEIAAFAQKNMMFEKVG